MGAAFAFVVVPSYLTEWFGDKALNWFPLFIALGALGAARRYRRADEGPGRSSGRPFESLRGPVEDVRHAVQDAPEAA